MLLASGALAQGSAQMQTLQQRLQLARQRQQGGSHLDFAGPDFGGGDPRGRGSPHGYPMEAIGEGHESDADMSLGVTMVRP
jgi:hypothetical protein